MKQNMCAITDEQEGKINPENAPLHLSHSISPKNGDYGENNTDEGFIPMRNPNASTSEDGEDPVNVSLSLSQAGAKHAEGKSILSLMDEEGENEFNRSQLENSGRALSIGSISEARDTNDNDVFVGDTNKGFCAGIMLLPDSVCQGSTGFAEQMDVFMRCQHPMDLLTVFQEDGKGNGESMGHLNSGDESAEPQVHRVSGYHALPQSCEYCGSPNIDLCKDNSDCTRPKSYFPRGKPPFYSKGGLKWKEEKKGAI